MARRLRELRTKMTVGEYSFEMVVNRDILHKSLSNCEGIWEFMQSNQDVSEEDLGKLSMAEIIKKADETDKFYESLDGFVLDILPRMIAEAEVNGEKMFNGTVDEFLDYCDGGGVLDEVEMEVFKFAMLGFTSGRGNTDEKPKLKVVMK